MLKGIASTLLKVWMVPVIALGLVGAWGLAESWSGLFTTSVPRAVMIGVNDLDNIGREFQDGSGQTAPGPEIETPAPGAAAGTTPS